VKGFLDNFAAILGAVTLALLLVSVTHEYGYFWIVGSRFQTFLSTTDYFNNAMLWLPWIFVALYAYVDWHVLLGKRKYDYGWNWPTYLWFLFIFGVPIASLFVLDEVAVYVFLVPGFLAWLLLAGPNLPYANAESDDLKLAHRAMLLTPIVLAISFGWGIIHGQSALKSFDEPYTIELKSGSVNRVLLRTFDKGVLVRDTAEKRVEFVKWDEIVRLYRFAPPERKMPVSCAWFGINCSEPPYVP
jgi:hypothetical protein